MKSCDVLRGLLMIGVVISSAFYGASIAFSSVSGIDVIYNFVQGSITVQDISENIQLISHRAMAGRGTGQDGEDLAALFLARELRKYGLKPFGDSAGVERSYFQNFFKEFESYSSQKPRQKEKVVMKSKNVLGIIEGDSRKDEYIIIGAHYDHLGTEDNGKVIYPGADDNGSGVTAVLEIAEAFSQLQKTSLKPQRSIIFALWGAEERGLCGSEYFVTQPLSDRGDFKRFISLKESETCGSVYFMRHLPVNVSLNKIVLVINLDMIGRNKDKEIGIETPAGKNFATVYPDLFNVLTEMNKSVGLNLIYEEDFGGSDHAPFIEANPKVNIVNFFAGLHEDYHKPTDTWEKINCAKIKDVATLAFLVVWHYAYGAEQAPK